MIDVPSKVYYTHKPERINWQTEQFATIRILSAEVFRKSFLPIKRSSRWGWAQTVVQQPTSAALDRYSSHTRFTADCLLERLFFVDLTGAAYSILTMTSVLRHKNNNSANNTRGEDVIIANFETAGLVYMLSYDSVSIIYYYVSIGVVLSI